MTSYPALDYTAPIPGSVLKSLGYLDVFRYLGDPKVWPKAMTAAEVKDLRNNGIRIHLNYEQTADFMTGGFTAGVHFAEEARRWADSLGFGADEPIIYSDDVSTPGSGLYTIHNFLSGATQQEQGNMHRVGCYGQFSVVKAAIDWGFQGWQTDAWSYGQRDPRAIAWQGGGTVLINGVRADNNMMNPEYIRGITMAKIPPTIAARWPDMAGEFPPGADFDPDNAGIWADAGARRAAEIAEKVLNLIQSMSFPSVGQGRTLSDADVEAVAIAVVKKMSGDLAAG